MTSSWNDFSLGKLDSKDSTPPPATPALSNTLNLASLAPEHTAPKPVPGNNNSLLDVGTGFVQGVGKQTFGMAESIFSVDNALLKKNIAAGGSGTGAEGMGWVPVAGKLIHGVSSTVSLAYHNPDAILAIPGQLSQQWNQGDLKTRADMAGQATVLIGSLFVGGSGAAKAGNLAGDLREASMVSKGLNTLGETGTTMRTLETTVTGLRGSTLMGDASALGRTSSLMTDATNLTRTSALVGDGTALAADANLLTRSSTALDQAASGILRTGSFGEKVLPATEGATKFLVKSGDTASSLGLGEMSMPNRLLGLQTTEQSTGVVSKFLERFKPTGTPELETTLSGTVQNIPKFGRGANATGDLASAGRLVDLTGDAANAGRVSNLTGDAGRLTSLPGVTTDLGTAGKLTGATTDLGTASRVTGLAHEVPAITPLADVSKVGGLNEAGLLTGRVTETVAPQVVKVEHTLQAAEQLAPHIDQFAEQANLLRTTGNLGAKSEGALTELETGLAKFRTAGSTADRVEGLGQLSKTLNVLEQQGVETSALRNTLTNLQTETTAVERVSQLRAATTQIAEHSTALTSQTAELTAKFGERASVQELELATKQLAQAGSATEKAQALANVERATAKVVADIPAESTAALRTTVESLKAPVQLAAKSEAADVIAAQIADRSTALTRQVADLASSSTSPAVRELDQAARQFAQAGTATEKAQALANVEKATAKVVADLPAESGAALRTTVESLKAPVQLAAKSEAADLVAAQIVDRSTALTRQVAELTSTSTSPAVRELDLATKQLAQAGNATERAQAFASVEKASAQVMSELPAESAAALRTTVESLRNPVQIAARSEVADIAAAQIAERSTALTETTTELAVKYGSRSSVQELTNATRQFNEAVTATDRAQALSAVERASVRVANDIPEAGAGLRNTVEALRAPVQTAAKVEQSELVVTQIAERSNQLAAETAQLSTKFAENPAVREMSTAAREFNQATNAVDKAEAYARMEKAAFAVKDISPEGAQVARTVESLSAPVETAARAQRIESAVARVDEGVSTLSAQTKTLAQEVAVEGRVPASVRELDAATTRMQQATTATEKAQAYAAVQKSATEVAAEFPAKSTQIGKTVESIAPHVESAERLTQFENVSSKLAYHADDVAKEASLLKATSTAPLKSEAALTELQTSASTFKAASATERTEQLAQMNKNLRLVEAEVGEAKVAGLRTSVARLENEAGTFERMATVDKSVAQVSEQSQSVLRQVAELEAKATPAARVSLENIRVAATETGAVNALNRTEQLSLRAKDIAVVEREMGTAAGAQMRQAIADLDRTTAAARTSSIDLVEYQGAKITQQLGYLQDGSLGSRVQALRLEQLDHDLAVMKSVVPADSAVAPHLVKLEQQISGVDAVANILAHPEVARAPGRELLKLAESADKATATAAADRIVLSLKSIEKLGDGPVSGLISERAQFWSNQRKLSQLEDTVKSQLFESGKLFGLPVNEPIFKKTLADIAMATGGILLLDGAVGYNLNKLAAMARDNVLSAQAEAQARKDDQLRKEAEKSSADKSTDGKAAGAASTHASTSQTAASQNVQGTQNASTTGTGNTNAAAGMDAPARALAGQGSDNYVRTSQQTVFRNDGQEAKMSPAMQVYGTPKFLPANETNNIPAGSFPTTGASWWWKQQHGGNPWGFNRGPGAPAVASEEARPTVQITPRARGIAATPEQDLTKIAQVRFPIPRVMDISNQAMLLNSPNQFSSKAGRPGSFGGAGGANKSWTTVDWSQIGSHRVSASEGGKGNQDLSKLEKDEELGIDGGGGVTAGQNQAGATLTAQNLSQHANAPNGVDPNDPNAVVAAHTQPMPGDDNLAKV